MLNIRCAVFVHVSLMVWQIKCIIRWRQPHNKHNSNRVKGKQSDKLKLSTHTPTHTHRHQHMETPKPKHTRTHTCPHLHTSWIAVCICVLKALTCQKVACSVWCRCLGCWLPRTVRWSDRWHINTINHKRNLWFQTCHRFNGLSNQHNPQQQHIRLLLDSSM